LIHELAAFENATSSVQATASSLLATLSFPTTSLPQSLSDFTPGFARTLLLTASYSSTPESGESAQGGPATAVAGMALFFTNYSTWRGAPGVYLEDLYVRPEFRRKGYARTLLRALAEETLQLGGKRLEWSCLKWNEDALRFYRSLGAQEMQEWVGLRVDGEDLERLAGR
jgi:GNAT superfamily N-acetyltransferase